MRFTNTYKSFSSVSQILIKGLRDALKLQEYHATGKLSRSFVGIQENGKKLILNIISNKKFKPKFFDELVSSYLATRNK